MKKFISIMATMAAIALMGTATAQDDDDVIVIHAPTGSDVAQAFAEAKYNEGIAFIMSGGFDHIAQDAGGDSGSGAPDSNYDDPSERLGCAFEVVTDSETLVPQGSGNGVNSYVVIDSNGDSIARINVVQNGTWIREEYVFKNNGNLVANATYGICS